MQSQSKPGNSQLNNPYKISGFLMIAVGLLLGLDQYLKTGWLSFVIFPLFIDVVLIGLRLYMLNSKIIRFLLRNSKKKKN